MSIFFSACRIADILYVVDESSSLSDSDFINEMIFVNETGYFNSISALGVHQGLIQFATTTSVWIKLTDYSVQRDFEQRLFQNTKSNGFTALTDALILAKNHLNSFGRIGVNKYVLFITDGVETIFNPSVTLAQAAADLKAIATVYAFGIGREVDPVLLKNVIASNGLYFPAANFSQFASKDFVELVNSVVCIPPGEKN